MRKEVTILTGKPTIIPIAEQKIRDDGVLKMAEWVREHRPDCVPEGGFQTMWDLLPHGRLDRPNDERLLSDNEVLAELSGRKCYDSFAEKAGKKTNREYFEHIVSMDPKHTSIFYHAKMTFFFAGVSRKFSHQFIRNYVGSDRSEEGSPSQESTRFTHHYGFYVAPPYIIDPGNSYLAPQSWRPSQELEEFRRECQHNYDTYCDFIARQIERYEAHHGKKPTSAHRKDIHEAGAGLLNMSAETSFIWTSNPVALCKFLLERCHEAADAEIFRFGKTLAPVCFAEWQNLFLDPKLEGVRAEIQR